VQFQATITKQSQYVAKPSPEVDALWEELGVGRTFLCCLPLLFLAYKPEETQSNMDSR